MTYVEAPTPYKPRPTDPPAVFLAGGITGCENWQRRAAERLTQRAVVLNPRRAAFPIDDPSAAPEQIRWEHAHLHAAALTVFWFPACDAGTTTQPIALLELGAALGEGRRLVVGADPTYPRALDVQWQTKLARPGLTVHATLSDALNAAEYAIHRLTDSGPVDSTAPAELPDQGRTLRQDELGAPGACAPPRR